MVKWGVLHVASEPPGAPGYYTSTLMEIGHKEDLYATCLYLLLVRDNLGVTNVGLTSVTSHSFSTGSSVFVIYYSSLLSNIFLITGGTNSVYNSEPKYSSVRAFSS